jgi:hypothetical protein
LVVVVMMMMITMTMMTMTMTMITMTMTMITMTMTMITMTMRADCHRHHRACVCNACCTSRRAGCRTRRGYRGIRSVTASPCAARQSALWSLLVNSLMEDTPRSLKMCAAMA